MKQLGIGLFMPGTPGFFSDVLMGVQTFGRGKWCVETANSLAEAEGTTDQWRPRGIIVSTLGGNWEPLIKRLNVPTVLIGGDALPQYPRVLTDDAAIGRTAGEYFLGRGFTRFAYCGYDTAWSIRRESAFLASLAKAGRECAVLRAKVGQIHTMNLSSALETWLKQLPLPTAIFTCHDRIAMFLGHACRNLNLLVPADVAILGVDNNALETGFTQPPISSVVGSAHRIGFEAAALLESLIQGKSAPAQPIRVEPAGVEERASTDVYASEDKDIVAALKFIEEHSDEPINVNDVAKAVIVTRRMLERKFQTHLNRSPRAHILSAHIGRAKELLIKTNLNTLDVALRSGFPSASKLADVFRREVRISPTAFRKLYGTGHDTGAKGPSPQRE